MSELMEGRELPPQINTDTDIPVRFTPAAWPSASAVFKLTQLLSILAFLIIYLESEVKFPEQALQSTQPKD